MTVQVPIDDFGGIVLSVDPEEIGLSRARDLIDCLPGGGKIRARWGASSKVTRSGHTPMALGRFGTQTLAAWEDGVRIYDSSWTAVASSTLVTNGFTNIGDNVGGASAFFVDQLNGYLYRWNGSSFGAAVLSGYRLAYTAAFPVSVRLALVGESIGYGGSPLARVRFSDPGNPTSYTANNYEDLDPGDQESIQGIAAWQDKLFVFKESKFFVYYGESTNGTGQPIFNSRPFRNTVGVVKHNPFTEQQQVCVANDGVYYRANDGIYRTQGDLPVKVSGDIDPWFTDQSPTQSFGDHVPPWTTNQGLSSDGRFVYVRASLPLVAPPGSPATWVYDTFTGQWTLYSLVLWSACALGQGTNLVGVQDRVVSLDSLAISDYSGAIAWQWWSGRSDLGSPDVKVIRNVRVWGTGGPTLSVYTDYQTAASPDPGAATLTLGASPSVDDDVNWYSRQGTFFSIGLSGGWGDVVNRIVIPVRETRLAGVG